MLAQASIHVRARGADRMPDEQVDAGLRQHDTVWGNGARDGVRDPPA